MFMLVWGPTVAAVSVVLDHADNPVIVSTALEGLMHAARIAAYHHIDEARCGTAHTLSKLCKRDTLYRQVGRANGCFRAACPHCWHRCPMGSQPWSRISTCALYYDVLRHLPPAT